MGIDDAEFDSGILKVVEEQDYFVSFKDRERRREIEFLKTLSITDLFLEFYRRNYHLDCSLEEIGKLNKDKMEECKEYLDYLSSREHKQRQDREYVERLKQSLQ